MFTIIIGENASTLEQTASEDLKLDLENVTGKNVNIIKLDKQMQNETEKQFPEIGATIIVGCPETNSIIKGLSEKTSISLNLNKPGRRGGIIDVLPNLNPNNSESMIILAGSDPQGAQYMVYEFSSVELGVDPFEYWTDKEANASSHAENVESTLKKSLKKYRGLSEEDGRKLRKALVAKMCMDRIVYHILNGSPVSDIYFQVAHGREMMIKATEGGDVHPVSMSTMGWLAKIEDLPRDQKMPAELATELAKKSIEWKQQIHDFIGNYL